MKRFSTFSALFVAGSFALVAAARAQDPAANQTQSTSQQTTIKTTTIEGKVVRYEPGKTIVVMGPDNKEVSYILSTNVVVPADIEVGRVVTLTTEPSEVGAVTVTRITTRTVNPDGSMKTETQTQSTNPDGSKKTEIQTQSTSASGDQTSVKTTTITGTVSAFEPGKSVTIVLPDKKTVVYTVDTSSVVPSDLTVGKTYTVQTTTTKNGVVVRKIVLTKTKTTSPQ